MVEAASIEQIVYLFVNIIYITPRFFHIPPKIPQNLTDSLGMV